MLSILQCLWAREGSGVFLEYILLSWRDGWSMDVLWRNEETASLRSTSEFTCQMGIWRGRFKIRKEVFDIIDRLYLLGGSDSQTPRWCVCYTAWWYAIYPLLVLAVGCSKSERVSGAQQAQLAPDAGMLISSYFLLTLDGCLFAALDLSLFSFIFLYFRML